MADKLTLDRNDMKDRATAHLRIYVGGLTDNATVEELYEHFIPYGQINGIVINRNFGFVQFELEQSAKDAIAKADGSTFQGKALNVRTAQTNAEKKAAEVVQVQPELPPAVALTDNIPVVEEPGPDDMYDSYGNFIGDVVNDPFATEEPEQYPPAQTETMGMEMAPAVATGPPPARGRGRGARGGTQRGGRGGQRGGRGGAQAGFKDQSPQGKRGNSGNPDWPECEGFDRDRYTQRELQFPPQSNYPRDVPVTERNDCEIIVVSKALTEYAEYIEGRLKRQGIVVDLLFPMEDVPIGKVLGNIASRGCLYAILVMPQNQEHRSLTLTILHGLPQEHRNMPIEDALQLLQRDFQEVQRGGSSGREAVYALLGQLADGRTLTVLQYDKVIEYLQERREQQVKIELGEPLTTAKKEVDLQQRILSLLNEKKAQNDSSAEILTAAVGAATAQNKLLNDPTVRKALDSILQKLV